MPYAAMECVVKLAQRKLLDSEVVRALLRVMTLFPIGSFVVLSDGRLARVIRRNGNKYTTPIVQVVQNADSTAVPADWDQAIVDLANDKSVGIVQALPTPGTEEIVLSDEVLSPRRPKL